ncbi:MAG: DMT family transporter [Bacillota bacterium]|nr:DMT family transporter [Bacillota bacterium]
MRIEKSKLADISLILVALLWGGGFIAVSSALKAITPMYLMTMRMSIAACTFLLLFPKLRGINATDLKYGFYAAVTMFLGFGFQTVGLQYTEVSKQGFLTATYVVFVPFLYWIIYRRMPQKKVFLASFIVLIGIGLVGLTQDLTIGLGDTLTLCCAFFFALQIIVTAIGVEKVSPFKLAFLQFVFAAMMFGISAVLTESFPTAISGETWIAVLYMSVFATFVCFLVQTIAQKHTSPARASIFLSLESVFAAILGVMMLGEELTFRKLVGFTLIFASVLMIEVDFKKLFAKKSI